MDEILTRFRRDLFHLQKDLLYGVNVLTASLQRRQIAGALLEDRSHIEQILNVRHVQ
jgi:hypothetical protein